MRPTPQAIAESISVITAGMNSGVSPRLVPPNQVAFAINLTFRNGLPRTRPIFRKINLAYDDGYFAEDTELLATEALFQDAHFYQAFSGGQNCLISMIGGRVFRYLLGATNGTVQDISLPDDLNDSLNPNTWMWQSEDFLIIQDGQANPLFFDGAGLRRSMGSSGNELPPGCMGAYVQGRNWVTLPDRQSFIGGDLVYSHGFADGYGGREAVLQTTENTFLSGGGAFALPLTAGKINAMIGLATVDTSLGQGPLQVFTGNSCFSVQVPFERTMWADSQFPLMTISLTGYGALSQYSAVAVNGDIWMRSFDGLRSFRIGRRDLASQWVNTPQSVEMEKVLLMDIVAMLDKCSGVVFDNRYLVTCSPHTVRDRGTAYRGLVALDFNNISNLTQRNPPAYDGLWTGLEILKILKGTFDGTERCFVFALDAEEKICLYELLTDGRGRFDHNGDEDVGVESVLESRSMPFADGGNALKRLFCTDLFLDRLLGPGNGMLNWQAQYRSDENTNWEPWHQWTLCAPAKDCRVNDCPEFADVFPGYRTYLRLPQPQDECNPITQRQTRTGYEFSLRLKWTGYVQLNRALIWAQPAPETVQTACPTSESCTLLSGCEEPWFGYKIE